MKQPKTPLRRGQSGFTLIEVLVAVLICSIGLLGIVGLQARAIQYSVGAEDVNRAALLADEAVWAIQDQKSVPLSSTRYAAWQARVQDPNVGFAYGQGEIGEPDANGIVRITITWRPPDSPDGAQPRQYVTEVAVVL
ncbi:MAG: prepilin-type N-terminal cleavage/methylation domain-containing protein [Rhizobacter sp.]|nr:prepilin-type N-terminal cleavage/methylation domain-containing protein [Rhizobacter sp.]